MSETLTVTTRDRARLVVMDDGKANALGFDLLDALQAERRAAEDEGQALVLAGRPGRFSGGFDLKVMTSGIDNARAVLKAGAELGLDLLTLPVPVVIACTGHAIAMGAILLLCVDERVGAEGESSIGMTEVAIGMPLPRFAIALARHRLSPRFLTAAVNHGRAFAPDAAVEAGYLDETVPPDAVIERAVARADHLVDTVHPKAFRMTRGLFRGPIEDEVRAGLAADLETFEVLSA
jgi:enoyl-CoA hydratase